MERPEEDRLMRRWLAVAIATGLVASVAYPVMVFVPMPRLLTVVTAAAFGPALAFASVGLYRIVALHRDSVAAQIAAISNVVAGGIVTCMLVVQMQIRFTREDLGPEVAESLETTIDWLWQVVLGLDVSFDVFVGIGTVLFGLTMLRHPLYGRVVGAVGVAIGSILVLGFTLYAFPALPVEIGLVDPGPIAGAWYLAVVLVTIARGRRWLDQRSPREAEV